jgi:hypothetical protein
MIKIPELEKEVEDVGEFNDRASEILEEFCIELDKQPGMSRPADPKVDSFLDETNFSHIWIGKAPDLINAEVVRLYHIGEKYFGRPCLDLNIKTSWFREP